MQNLSSSLAKSSLVVQRRSLEYMGNIWLVQQGLSKTTSFPAPFHMRKFSGGGWRIVMDTWHFRIAYR